MGQVIKSPTPTVCQLSGRLPSGEFMLSVLARRTYEVDEAGRCRPADEQTPLLAAPEPEPDDARLMAADADHHPYKLRTDVIVRGHAYGHRRVRRMLAQVRVGGHEAAIAVIGERTCALRPGGQLAFSDPAPIDRVALAWTNAYGGRDHGAEERHGNPLKSDPELAKSMQGVDLDAASPFIYPRNPVGRGWLVEPTRAAVERLALPLLEDPTDVLTPERIVAGWIDRWHRMPLPRSTGWVDYGWYPRVGFFGIVPIVDFFDEPPLEVERGLVPEYLADGTGATTPLSPFEIASGAAPGLQVPLLRGGEPVQLDNLHATRPRWRFAVPPAPALAIDAREGKLRATEPVLHTLVVEPDAGRVTVVWRGAGKALRPYAPQELATMPLRVQWND